MNRLLGCILAVSTFGPSQSWSTQCSCSLGVSRWWVNFMPSRCPCTRRLLMARAWLGGQLSRKPSMEAYAEISTLIRRGRKVATRESAGELNAKSSIKMERPESDSLNSLSQTLRQARPLYDECRSILNYLDERPTAACRLSSAIAPRQTKAETGRRTSIVATIVATVQYGAGLLSVPPC